MRMLFSRCRLVWLMAAMTLGSLLALACDTGSEYDLQGQAVSESPAGAPSTDGSWSAALGELLWPLITKDDTEYAPGYSEEVYRSLKVGARKETVEQSLGPPLKAKEFPDGLTYWYYSRHGPRFDSYFVRILGFDQDGRLITRRSYFYVD